jgi:hypothetical protein
MPQQLRGSAVDDLALSKRSRECLVNAPPIVGLKSAIEDLYSNGGR